jgi:hypothetical protein
MTGHLLQVEPDLLARLRADPGALRDAIAATRPSELDYDDAPAVIDAALAGADRGGALWRLVPRPLRHFVVRNMLGRVPERPHAPPEPAAPGLGRHLDLGEDWHVLHVCLTGDAGDGPPPAGDAVLGGDEIGPDLGYGPARALSPERAAAVAGLLRDLGPSGICARFHPRELGDDVYGVERARGGGARAEVRARAEQLCRFYADAERRGLGVLLWLA